MYQKVAEKYFKEKDLNIQTSKIANLPTKFGEFKIKSYKEGIKEHLVVFTDILPDVPVVRVHSECLTGDAIGSLKCDCGEQLEYALKYINKNGGMVIYLRQEGRDIGLLNKVNAYALQDMGLDTIEANHQLGFSADERRYEIVEFILNDFNIKQIRLLTNNPKKIESIKGVKIIERIPIITNFNAFNKDYLEVKRDKMGHLL